MLRAYGPAERVVDGMIHAAGTVASVCAVVLLLSAAAPAGEARTIVAAVVYGTGLIAMLWLSAAYNLITHPTWKERVRRLDHAAIFLMIAGSYTPFMLVAVGGGLGFGLLALVWVSALTGMALKLLHPRRFDRVSVVFYLALGWAGLPLAGPLIAALSTSTLVLLVVGGLLYSIGVAFHLWERLPFQNAIWHGFVLAAAVCHFLAVFDVVSS